MRLLLSLTCLAGLSAPAFASGGLGCEAKDKRAEIDLQAGVTRGMGSPLFNVNGSTFLRGKGIAPDLARMAFTDEHVAQYWLDGEELRVLLYRERDAGKPHGYVEVTILARAGEEGVYSGRYMLALYDGEENAGEGRTLRAEGRIGCFVE